MKKLVQFKHDIEFKNNLAEIVSISLDHDMKLVDNVIRGNLIISGSYKMNDISVNTEEFIYNIPVNIEAGKYILDDLDIGIEDFYYEIVDNKVLSVNIEVALDNVLEKEEIELVEEKDLEVLEPLERDLVDDKLLNNTFDKEIYSTYQVYIVKESDTIETILINYNISKESLMEYNDISEIKIGDKLIIPSSERDI